MKDNLSHSKHLTKKAVGQKGADFLLIKHQIQYSGNTDIDFFCVKSNLSAP